MTPSSLRFRLRLRLRFRPRFRLRLLPGTCLLVACLLVPATAGAALSPPSHPLFEGDQVHTIELTFHQSAWWDSLRANYEGLDDPLYMAAEFDWAGTHLDSIGVRFKGNSSYNSNHTEKKSFKLDIDEYVAGQAIDGLDKLNLNCGFLDPSFVREASCYEIAAAAGLPTVRTSFAALYINGTYWGLYTLIEQFDQQCIESRFGPGENGNLWKGDPHATFEYLGPDPAPYQTQYELETNEEQNDWTALVELIDVLNNTPIASLPQAIHPLLDVNSALAMTAVDNLTVNLDSYIGRGVNFYCYHRDLDGRFVFAEWDLNESFGIFNMFGLSLTGLKQLDPFWTSTQPGEDRPLVERLWQIEAYRELYLGHLRRLMAGAADPDTLIARMEAMRDLIRPYVQMEVAPRQLFTPAQFEAAMSTNIYNGPRVLPALEPFIRDRDAWLRGVIGAWTAPPGLVLNEVMPRNETTIADPYGEHDDWLEITNTGPLPVDLTGFALTDNPGNPDSTFHFPVMTIAPGEHVLVWADDQPAQGAMHAPFRLDGDGEDLYLLDGSTIVDQITYPALGTDQSYGRWPDGSGDWQLLSTATPGAANQHQTQPEEITLFLNEFVALNDSGLQDETGAFEDWVEIYNPGPDPVAMGGLFLTDDLSLTTTWPFPDTTLVAGGFLVVFCDDDPGDGPLHATFRLSGDGEEIGLFGRVAAGNLEVDSHVFGPQTTDVSEGRESDGGAVWTQFTVPTPGASNAGPNGVEGTVPGVLRLELLPNAPNPFNPRTTLRFTLPVAGQARLELFDVRGRLVVRLVDATLDAGRHDVDWDGRDGGGAPAASGIYFTRLTAGETSVGRRIALVR